MPSAKSAATRPVPTLADATAKTRSLIEDLQARLTGEGGTPNSAERPRHSLGRESAARKQADVEENATVEQAAVAEDAAAKDAGPKGETEEDLERQLQAYFEQVTEGGRAAPAVAASTHALEMEDIRARVVDRVVERILDAWSHPERGGTAGAAIRHEVVERLTDRVLEMLQKAAAQNEAWQARATATA